MAYNELLGDRIRLALDQKGASFEEKKMMGGLCFMVDDKMCVGIVKDDMMARIGPDVYEDALTKKGCSEMNFTGRPMNGFVFVNEDGISNSNDLEYWIQLSLDYNPLAKSSKKKSNKK